MPVYLLATLDTKGTEAAFLRDRLRELQIPVVLMDTSCIGPVTTTADIPREKVFAAAGTTLEQQQALRDRGAAVTHAAAGAAAIVAAACARGEVDAVLAIGGSAGTTIGTQAMRSLPIGVPKVMVSTLASGQVRPWVGDKDIAMFNSIVDIAGINRISRQILNSAAAAIAGMIRFRAETVTADRPLIAATMFGVTTPCVLAARDILEAAGYEVLIFHATGNGGQAMESLIREGLIAGVLDITTTELADELVGGILSAGPTRLTAAGEMAIPQVVSVGALDMVNFAATTPPKFAQRQFYKHNATVTLMRTTAEECRELGREIGMKLSAAKGPKAILFPSLGVSAIDKEGQPFCDVAARQALLASLREHAQGVSLEELPLHINDQEFAMAAAQRLLELLAKPGQ